MIIDRVEQAGRRISLVVSRVPAPSRHEPSPFGEEGGRASGSRPVSLSAFGRPCRGVKGGRESARIVAEEGPPQPRLMR